MILAATITSGQILITTIVAINSIFVAIIGFFIRNFIIKQEKAIESIKKELNAVLVAIRINDTQTKNIEIAYMQMMQNTKHRLDSQSVKIDHNTKDIVSLKTNIINIKEQLDDLKTNGKR